MLSFPRAHTGIFQYHAGMKYPPKLKLRLAKLIVDGNKTATQLESEEGIPNQRLSEWASQLRKKPDEDFEPKSTAAKTVTNKTPLEVRQAIIQTYWDDQKLTHDKIKSILASRGMEVSASTIGVYVRKQIDFMKKQSEQAKQKVPAKRSRKSRN